MKLFFVVALTVSLLTIRLAGNSQACTINCPSNIIVMAEKGKEGAVINLPQATASGDCGTLTYTPASGSFFRLGSQTVTVTSSTGQKCSFTVTVTDNEAPVLSDITISPKRLWPASNKMKKVAVNYTSSDNAIDVNNTLSVTSNDTASGNGTWQVVNTHLLRLKASRLATGEPRIYFITVTSTDAAGNSTKKTTSIAVSRTMVAKPL